LWWTAPGAGAGNPNTKLKREPAKHKVESRGDTALLAAGLKLSALLGQHGKPEATLAFWWDARRLPPAGREVGVTKVVADLVAGSQVTITPAQFLIMAGQRLL